MVLEWTYNPVTKQWEALANGWRAVVVRWASGVEWVATLENLEHRTLDYSAGYVFQWMDDAQSWCVAELVRLSTVALAP